MPKLWKKKRREIPPDAICRNCGVPIVGRYCHACGQDFFAGQEQALVQLITNLLDNAFAFDNKVWVTLRHLLFKPGFLSGEYRLGRIVPYVQPVKLFWMSTLIFFALLFANTGAKITAAKEQEAAAQKTEQQAAPTVETTPTTEPEAATNSIEKENEEQGKKLRIQLSPPSVANEKDKPTFQAEIEDSEQFTGYLKAFAPYATFLLIPLFAMLLKLFFRRKKYFYLYHLTFAIHFHSFLWILWSLLFFLDILFPAWKFPNWLQLLIFLLPGIYLMIAFYRFYQPKRKWSVIWKAVLITWLYFVLILVFIAIVVAILDMLIPDW